MNTAILKKCLDELSKDAPRLDYVRGILETLIEANQITTKVSRDNIHVSVVPTPDTELPAMPDLNKIRAIATSEMV